jgi:hypothetical protein
MTSQKSILHILAENRRRFGYHCGFGAANVREKSSRGENRTETLDEFDNRTNRSREKNHIAASHGIGGMNLPHIDRTLGTCPIKHWLPIATNDSAFKTVLPERQSK